KFSIQYKVSLLLSCVVLCVSGVLSVSLSSQAGLTVEAEPGDDVTLWCKHSLIKSNYLFWYKHTWSSVPDRVACKYYSLSSSNTCFFIPESNRSVMRVNSTFSSLTITAVNLSDSGLYYCSSVENKDITFTTATYLQLKERKEPVSDDPEKSKEGLLSFIRIIRSCRARRIIGFRRS
uniref:Ig-like domain-containing protein n=1 Tax=Pygocentrus nattereri TaxID=42514 RepID=A0AAR2IVN3_PYGNA